MVNNDRTRRIHRWGGGAALAGAAVLTAGTIGAVQADRPTHPDLLAATAELLASSGPTDLLDGAIANFTEGNDALHQIDTTVHASFGGFVDSQISTQSLLIQSIGGLEHAQDAISANSAPFGFLVDGFFTLFNLGWNMNSELMLTLDQAMETALSKDLWGFAALAEAGLYVLDFQAFSATFAGLPIVFAGGFF